MFIGAAVKVVTAYSLIGIPSVNIDGAAYSTLIAYAVAAFLNIRLVYKLAKPSKQTFVKIVLTLIANAAMLGAAKVVFSMLEASLAMRLNLLISIFVAVLVYAGFIFFGKVVTKADFDGLEK